MIIICHDVTDPMQSAKPFLLAKGFVTNPDGSQAIQMPDGHAGLTPCYAYQVPSDGGNSYGDFRFASVPGGAYQNCKVAGQLVSYWTRPQDQPYVYTWMELPN